MAVNREIKVITESNDTLLGGKSIISLPENSILGENGTLVFTFLGKEKGEETDIGYVVRANQSYSDFEILLQTNVAASDFNGILSRINRIWLLKDGTTLVYANYSGSFSSVLDDETLFVFTPAGEKLEYRESYGIPGLSKFFANWADLEIRPADGGGAYLITNQIRESLVQDRTRTTVYKLKTDGSLDLYFLEGETEGAEGNFFDSKNDGFINMTSSGKIIEFGDLNDSSGTSISDSSGTYIYSPGANEFFFDVTQNEPEFIDSIRGVYFIRGTLGGGWYGFHGSPIVTPSNGILVGLSLSTQPAGYINLPVLYMYEDQGALREIARPTQPIASVSAALGALDVNTVAVNANNDVAFAGKLLGTTGSDAALFINDSGTIKKVVRVGETTPEGGSTFIANPEFNKPLFENMILFDDGSLVFRGFSQKEGTTSPSGRSSAIYEYTSDGNLERIIGPGDVIDGKTVQFVLMTGGNNQKLLSQSGANHRKDLVMTAVFEDSSIALLGAFVKEMPERIVILNEWFNNGASVGWVNGLNLENKGYAYSLQMGWVYYNKYPWIYDTEWGWLYFISRRGAAGPVDYYSPTLGELTIFNESALGWFYSYSEDKYDNFLSPKNILPRP